MANVFVVSGNLANDPEVITLNSGTEKGVLRIVNNRRYTTKDGEKKEDSVGFDVECWGGITKVLQYLRKGSGIIVTGRIRENRWTDKESGENRRKLVVVAEDIDFMDKKDSGSSSGNKTAKTGSNNDEHESEPVF